MSPIVHERMYPEVYSSCLLNYTLRILVDPPSIVRITRLLLDIDTLRTYLRDLESPCRIILMLPADVTGQFGEQYAFMEQIGLELLPSASIIVPEAAAAFPEPVNEPLGAAALASTALIGRADIVLSEDLATQEEAVRRFRDLNVVILSGERTIRNCEIFVRGHEIPWSFNRPAWWKPWMVFYPIVEPDIQLMERFWRLSMQKGVSTKIQERIRSLGFNRWSAVLYTRDKLLFYVLQRRTAKRQNLTRQDFTFELAYYLNHYFLLFWGALDQVSWIVNEICNLGFQPNQWRNVGVAKQGFLNRLRNQDPEMAAEFEEPEFQRWINVLKLTRHYVAHQGTAQLSPLYEKPAEEPTDAEIDREIEKSQRWREDEKLLPREILEAFRPTFRMEWRLEHYRQISDASFHIQGETDHAIVFPLENIEWEYDRFKQFVLNVSQNCMARLDARPDAR